MIRLRGVRKYYYNGQNRIQAANIPDLILEEGNFYALMGPSGAGKSTILYIISALESPDEGSVVIKGRKLSDLPPNRAAAFRFENMGVVFQKDNLIEELTVCENLLLFLEYKGRLEKNRIRELLEMLGVIECKDRFPGNLSAGERQRVAIARALLFDPDIIIADEPTANLDSENSKLIFQNLKELSLRGKLVIVATHNILINNFTDKVLPIRDGTIEGY